LNLLVAKLNYQPVIEHYLTERNQCYQYGISIGLTPLTRNSITYFHSENYHARLGKQGISYYL